MVQHGITESTRSKGLKVFHNCLRAHGGTKVWNKLNGWVIEGEEVWPHMLQRLFNLPFEHHRQKRRYEYLAQNNRVVVESIDEQGQKVLVQSGASEKRSHRWLSSPTMRFFFEMPFSFRKRQELSYAGEGTLAGRKFDLVFLSLRGKKERSNDFLLWVHRKTGILHLVQYDLLGREKGPSAGAVVFADHRVVGGIVVPFKVRVLATIHDRSPQKEYHLEKVKFDAFFTKSNTPSSDERF